MEQDTDETGARQGETLQDTARQGRDTRETGARQRETLARQERDMEEDENMDIFFFIFLPEIFS